MSPVPAKMFVTTDAVALRLTPDEGLELLLVKRANEPFQGRWALPGGFVDEEEDLPDACARELAEETGVRAATLVQLGAYGRPGRDPRGRNVSVVYLAPVRPDGADARAGDDAAQARWHPVDDLPELAFDHAEIVGHGLRRFGALLQETHIVFGLMPERFTMDELRQALGAVRGELVTEGEALAWAKRARVVRHRGATPREGESLQCAAADLLTPLR
jgi:8-oxo-dGTP diphosphatase